MARIVILGGGFAAIAAAEMLSAAVGQEHALTLVSKSTDFTFYPAIVPMVFGDFKPDDIRFDLRPKLAERNIRFVQGEVKGINTRYRSVDVDAVGKDLKIPFDYLLVAVGRRLEKGAIPGLFEYSHDLLGVNSALRFREAISGFDTGSIVVGLCPDATLPVPVCESALGLAKRFKTEISNGDVSVSVVVPTSLDKAFSGAGLFRDIEGEFDREGIRLVSDFAVAQVEKDRIVSVLGASLKHDLLMLIPPFGGRCLTACLYPVTNILGFANVNPLMQVGNLRHVYAAGEIVSTPGPRFAYMAMRQGKVAAVNILAELAGETPTVEYEHRIEWAIGEKYTDPVFFHYGFWDDTLEDFDPDALFGMARQLHERYGPITRF